MRLKNFAAAVLILFACFYAAAETISLEECIERTLKESDKIKAMQESEAAAKSGKDGTGSILKIRAENGLISPA